MRRRGARPLSWRERGRGEGTCALREWRPQLRVNPREHGIDVITNLGVREADDPYAHAFENFGAARVIVSEPFMLTAVEFHDELSGVTVEVHDEAVERNLPAELRAVKAASRASASKGFPQLASGSCAGGVRTAAGSQP